MPACSAGSYRAVLIVQRTLPPEYHHQIVQVGPQGPSARLRRCAHRAARSGGGSRLWTTWTIHHPARRTGLRQINADSDRHSHRTLRILEMHARKVEIRRSTSATGSGGRVRDTRNRRCMDLSCPWSFIMQPLQMAGLAVVLTEYFPVSDHPGPMPRVRCRSNVVQLPKVYLQRSE